MAQITEKSSGICLPVQILLLLLLPTGLHTKEEEGKEEDHQTISNGFVRHVVFGHVVLEI